MSQRSEPQVSPDSATFFAPVNADLIQRKCACGGSLGLDSECGECQKGRLKLQRYSADRPEPSKLMRSIAGPLKSSALLDEDGMDSGTGHNFGNVQVGANGLGERIQTKLVVSSPADPLEQEADRLADLVTRRSTSSHSSLHALPTSLHSSAALIQRQPAADGPAQDNQQPPPEPAPAPLEPQSPEPAEAAHAPLILDDDAQLVGPSQMRKSDFLDALSQAVCSAADAQLAAVGRTAQGCPYIQKWIGYYRTRSGPQIEQAARRYVPEAAGLTSAQDYVPLIAERVRRAVTVWASTGELTGVPQGAPITPPPASPAASDTSQQSNPSGIHFKREDGNTSGSENAAEVRDRLGSGHALEASVRSRMESAFGHDFSRVHVHTDSNAGQLSTQLKARAFTVGSNIAFAPGQYRPGSLVGDALIAHELAHVVQQGGAKSHAIKSKQDQSGEDTLEKDADTSAMNAVVSLWSGMKNGLSRIARSALPSLRSGLKLQRCADCDPTSYQLPLGLLPLEIPAVDCVPQGVTRDEVKKLGGREGVLGVTKAGDLSLGSKTKSKSRGYCEFELTDTRPFTMEKFVFTQAGTYDTGTRTPSTGRCKGKPLTQKLVITPKMVDKIKAGEVEHCEDLKLAYSLSYGRYVRALQELTGGYCAENKSCEPVLKRHFKERTGIEHDDRNQALACLHEKTGERDTNNWHTVVLQKPVYDRACTTETYTPNHEKELKEVGKHPTVDLVKGCGEP